MVKRIGSRTQRAKHTARRLPHPSRIGRGFLCSAQINYANGTTANNGTQSKHIDHPDPKTMLLQATGLLVTRATMPAADNGQEREADQNKGPRPACRARSPEQKHCTGGDQTENKGQLQYLDTEMSDVEFLPWVRPEPPTKTQRCRRPTANAMSNVFRNCSLFLVSVFVPSRSMRSSVFMRDLPGPRATARSTRDARIL